jgi:uncharacterized membrane-anchored protein
MIMQNCGHLDLRLRGGNPLDGGAAYPIKKETAGGSEVMLERPSILPATQKKVLMPMPRTALFLICLLSLSPICARAGSGGSLPFVTGPANVKLRAIAQLDVPTGYVFLDGKQLQAILKRAGEPVSGNECGSVSPTNADWEIMFRFEDIGYVKDDEKNQLDADKLLDAIRRGTAAANRERERNGLATIEVVGWDQPPKYDETTHNLEWAVRGRSSGRDILNYNTRLLGRKGVMEVLLICDPEEFNTALPEFRKVLAGYSYQSGQTYAEFKSGDKVAKYGLAALVLGGAAVGAAKLGLFAWLAVFAKKAGKLIVVAVVAVVAFFKRMFAKLFGSKESGPDY